MLKKKYLLLLLVFSAFLASCKQTTNSTQKDSSSNVNESKILSIGLTNPVTAFNLLNTPDVQSRWAQRFMYEPLVQMINPLEFEPRLADSFETTDNQTYLIKLNEAAKWTDGKPITADDVIFTFELFVNPETEMNRAPAFSLIEGVGSDGKLVDVAAGLTGVEKINDYELSIRTIKPTDENLVKEFIGDNIYIVPKHIWETAEPKDIPSADFVKEPTVSSGPYKFVKFEKDSYLELERNEDFYLGEPKIKQIFLRMMTGANLATELSSGGIDLNASGGIGQLIVQDINALEANDNLLVKSVPSINPQVMLFNVEKIADANVRLAMSHAINREAIVNQLLEGRGEILNSPFGEQHPYKNKTMSAISYDPDQAKKLLAESDFDLSKEIELNVPLGNPIREQSANLIAADLESVGFKVKQSTYDFPTLLEKGRNGDFDLMLVGYGLTIDPDVTTYLSQNGPNNYSKFKSPKNEELLVAGREAVDLNEKRKIYDELQELWAEELPILSLYNADFVIIKPVDFIGGIHDFWLSSLSDVHQWEFGK